MLDKIILEDLNNIAAYVEGEKFREKKVLITGGAGFIGSWLSDVLISFDAQVTVVDDFSTGRKSNIVNLLKENRFELIEDDASKFKTDKKFDYIFYLAAHASPDEYQTKPIETLHASSFGTANIAELARKCDATMLFASTSEVYGDAEVVPTPESYWGKVNPIGSRSCYDEGKRFAEALLMAYCNQYGLDIKIPRIFNTYGPRLREDGLYGRALSRFIQQAINDHPITIYGDGKQTRSFCYITDTARALLLMITNPRARGEVINVGNTQEVTILELAEKIIDITKCKSVIEYCPLPKDDPKRRRPDTHKLEGLTNWKISVSFEDGLRRTIKWFSTMKQKDF
jgi:UDP-glucuronate decarboxylase